MQSRHPIGAGLAAAAILCATAFDNNAGAGAFAVGDFITHSQGIWGGSPSGSNPPALVMVHYGSIYTTGILEVGIPGTAGYSISFTGPGEVILYLPAIFSAGTLSMDHVNPDSTEAGAFAGEVVALTLNIDFSDAGITLGNSGIPFGDLVLHNVPYLPQLNGLTVRQYLAEVNTLLGSGSGIYSLAELYPVTNELNSAFGNGEFVSPFAQQHLRIACPADLNDDFAVDVNDLLMMIGAWGASGVNAADINNDNTVDVNDLLILIGGWGPCLSGPPPATNDSCSTPTNIGAGNTAVIPWDNTWATRDGLPTPASCNIFGDTDISRDLWFLWTAGADADGFVRVQTCASPGFDNKMAMYNYPTACPPTAAPIACADDGICAFGRAAFDVAIVPAQQYLIRIGSYNDFGPRGLGRLQILQNNP